jgi:flavin reductase (DIM6/NTAB) family NADH-FMN oxidoreductase RutF
VRDNTTKHTLENVLATKEVVINVVNYDIVQQMSLSSTDYPKGVNEFDKAGFTMLKSEKVAPYRVAESPVQFECKVNEVVPLGDQGGAGNLIVCEVVKLHVNEEVLDANGAIDQHKIDLVSRAGGSYYSRAKDGFFEIPKPIATLGIGVDAIPDTIRNSTVLTGNDLGKLGNVEQLPSNESVDNFAKDNLKFVGLNSLKKHTFAREFLNTNDIESAWKVLLLK